MIEDILITALIAAFVILFVSKIGAREYAQARSTRLISALFSCDFCLSFWACVIVSLVFLIFTQVGYFLWVPFAAAPLTRLML